MPDPGTTLRNEQVDLVQMKSGYAVAAIFTFRIAWNEFLLALFLTGRKSRTLPVAIQGFLTDEGVEWGRVMAMGTLIVIPSLIITFPVILRRVRFG